MNLGGDKQNQGDCIAQTIAQTLSNTKKLFATIQTKLYANNLTAMITTVEANVGFSLIA